MRPQTEGWLGAAVDGAVADGAGAGALTDGVGAGAVVGRFARREPGNSRVRVAELCGATASGALRGAAAGACTRREDERSVLGAGLGEATGAGALGMRVSGDSFLCGATRGIEVPEGRRVLERSARLDCTALGAGASDIALGAVIESRATRRDPGRDPSTATGAVPPDNRPRTGCVEAKVAGEGRGATGGRYTDRLLPSDAMRSGRPLENRLGVSRGGCSRRATLRTSVCRETGPMPKPLLMTTFL